MGPSPFTILDYVSLEVLDGDGEVVCGLVVHDVSDGGAELDVLLHVLLVPAALQVVEQHLPARVTQMLDSVVQFIVYVYYSMYRKLDTRISIRSFVRHAQGTSPKI